MRQNVSPFSGAIPNQPTGDRSVTTNPRLSKLWSSVSGTSAWLADGTGVMVEADGKERAAFGARDRLACGP
jgi:hypothetical protein